MGSRMVKRLLDAGHTVTGYNRTKTKADWLIEAGMQWADSPRAVAETADMTFSMVTSTEAVKAITQGSDGLLAGLTSGKIYIDMTTMSPGYSQELAAQVAERGAAMLDAPAVSSLKPTESNLRKFRSKR
jgi:3-hydroxyisobutyrate dehydrogenase-like beta-hydroxyacid dehydrogenase